MFWAWQDLATLIVYVLIAYKIKSESVKTVITFVLLAHLMSTPIIFDNVSEVMFYSILALIYVIPVSQLAKNKSYKSSFACLLMSMFQFAMAFDAWSNANVQTWLFNNFELLTALFHAVILVSFFWVKPIKIKGDPRIFAASMRRLLSDIIVSNCLWYSFRHHKN